MRFRCPHPSECVRTRHWTASAWRQCRYLDDDAAIREFEEAEQRRADAAWQEVFTGVAEQHVRLSPTLKADKQLSDIGERQLRLLTPAQLDVLGHLTGSGVGRVNRALRSGIGLNEGCAADLDWAGYRSNAEFAAAAGLVFSELGASLELTEPITAYRGLRMARSGDLAEQMRFDPGFVFAATTTDRALPYRTEDAWWGPMAGDRDASPVLLELKVKRAICIPHQEHRSPQLAAHLAQARRAESNQWTRPVDQHPTRLEGAGGQLVIPPGSSWQVIDSTDSTDQWVSLRLGQVC